jgi:hypothetical protein
MVGGGIRPPPLAELVHMFLGNVLFVAVGLFAARPRPGASPAAGAPGPVRVVRAGTVPGVLTDRALDEQPAQLPIRERRSWGRGLREVSRAHPPGLPDLGDLDRNQPLVRSVMRTLVPRSILPTGRARVAAACRTLALAGTTNIHASVLSAGSANARAPVADGSPASASGATPSSRSTRANIQGSRMSRYDLTVPPMRLRRDDCLA